MKKEEKQTPHTYEVVASHSRPESTELKFNNSQFIRKFPPRRKRAKTFLRVFHDTLIITKMCTMLN